MRFTEIISESAGTRLKDIAKIATNMQDADFWLVRKGSDKTVGKPVKEFDPSRIGIKVVKTDVLDPNYLYYAMMNLHNQGHFARLANGTTNLVNITVNDIANIPLGQQDVAEGTEQQLVTIYTNPAYKGATVDDRIKKSLPVTEAPFNKLQMWENSKSMKDPKVAQWVNNNLLPQLKLNGKLGPLVVWNNKGKLFVIDGNHRFIAYQAAGYNGNVPVQIVPDKMINIVDTVPGQQGVAEGEQPGKSVTDAIQKVMPTAQEIWFHGSRATGKHRKNSDTDILVVVPDDLIGDQYLSVVRILQKLSSHFDNYDIQPTKVGTNIHRIAQEEGQLLWSNKQGVAEGADPNKKYTIKKSYTMSKAGVEKSVWHIMDGDFVVDVTDLRRDAKYYADKWNAAEKESSNASQNLHKQDVAENFADGRNPQDKGDAKRHGVPTKASVSTLRKVAKQGGRKGQLAHWMANMKSGKAKNK